MKFDYSKTINEQLPTFDYYKDRYCSYELELINDRKEIERLKLHIMKIKETISTWNIENDEGRNDFKIPNKIIDMVWSDKE